MIVENVEQLFAIFIADLRNVENGDSDFDYDTTNDVNQQEVFSMADMMNLSYSKKLSKLMPSISEDCHDICVV